MTVAEIPPAKPTALTRLPWWKRLAFKQARAALLVAVAIGVALSLGQVVWDYHAELEELDVSVSRLMQSNEPAAVEAVWTLNAALAEGVVKGLVGFRPVVAASVRTSSGTVLADFRTDDGGSHNTLGPLFRGLANLMFGAAREVRIALPSPDPKFTGVIGYLAVTVAPEVIAGGFIRRSVLVVLSGVVRNVALAVLLFSVFYVMVSRRLTRLTEAVVSINPRKLAPDTEMSLRQRSGDEFEVLGDAMADVVAAGRGYMTEVLEARHALVVANRTLEDRVRQRTRELESAVGALENLAVTDSLTGLHNRRFFVDVLGKAMSLRRRNPNDGFAVLMADLDLFKNVNDTHGHAAGDQVLREMSEILRFSARESDTVARLGGEEFAVLMPEANAEQAAQLAERVRTAVEERATTFRNQAINVTVSIGVAEASDSLDTADGLLHAADMALYQAKEEGRNRVVVFAA